LNLKNVIILPKKNSKTKNNSSRRVGGRKPRSKVVTQERVGGNVKRGSITSDAKKAIKDGKQATIDDFLE